MEFGMEIIKMGLVHPKYQSSRFKQQQHIEEKHFYITVVYILDD